MGVHFLGIAPMPPGTFLDTEEIHELQLLDFLGSKEPAGCLNSWILQGFKQQVKSFLFSPKIFVTMLYRIS